MRVMYKNGVTLDGLGLQRQPFLSIVAILVTLLWNVFAGKRSNYVTSPGRRTEMKQ